MTFLVNRSYHYYCTGTRYRYCKLFRFYKMIKQSLLPHSNKMDLVTVLLLLLCDLKPDSYLSF